MIHVDNGQCGLCTHFGETHVLGAQLTLGMVRGFFRSALLIDASTYGDQSIFTGMQSQHADFEEGVTAGGQHVDFFDANNFWQQSYSMLLGTLLHESLHSNGQNDPTLASELGITADQLKTQGTSAISQKLASDCF